MRSENDIKKKLVELKREYTIRFLSIADDPFPEIAKSETISAGEQIKLLEWVLDIPYIAIQENQNKDE